MSLNTYFSQQDWERIAHDWTAWWEGDLDRPLVMINGTDLAGKARIGASMLGKKLGGKNYTLMDLINKQLASIFTLDDPVEEIIDGYTKMLSCIHCYGDAWPRWWPDFGPGIAAGFLGSNVGADENTVWFDMDEPINLATWQANYDENNIWFKRVQEVTQAAVDRWQDQVQVGITDLGGNLDILASLRGTQQLLMDCVEEQQGVTRCLNQITEQWLKYYQAQYQITSQTGRGCTGWAHLWAPSTFYMLQCDFSYMISPRMFRKFVMPDLEACCIQLDHAFYHLDGKGEIPHLDHLLELDRLNGIQWVPGAGAPPHGEWLTLMKHIIDAGKLCQIYVTAKGALQITRELGGKGFAFYITDQMSAGEAAAYLKEIHSI